MIKRFLETARAWIMSAHVEPVLHNRWVFYMAAVLHVVWAVMRLSSHAAFQSTPAAAFDEVPVELMVPSLLASSILAVVALKRRVANLATFMALAPQNFLVSVAVFTSMSAVLSQHYADGVPRPWEFIGADQAKNVLFGLAYSASYWISHLPAIGDAWKQGNGGLIIEPVLPIKELLKKAQPDGDGK